MGEIEVSRGNGVALARERGVQLARLNAIHDRAVDEGRLSVALDAIREINRVLDLVRIARAEGQLVDATEVREAWAAVVAAIREEVGQAVKAGAGFRSKRARAAMVADVDAAIERALKVFADG